MYVLTLEVQGLQLELRLNDVRQYLKRDATSSRLSLRLNAWLLPGVNDLTIQARVLPGAPPGKDEAAAAGQIAPDNNPPGLILTVKRGFQGEPLPDEQSLYQFAATPAQLSALGKERPGLLLQDKFDVGPLPWRPAWHELPVGKFGADEVYSYLQEYLLALRQRDMAWIIDANRIRTATMVRALGMDLGAVNAGYARRLADRDPGAWELVAPQDLVLSIEGAGRVCRVEERRGAPVIWVKGGERASGFSFVLGQVSQRFAVVG